MTAYEPKEIEGRLVTAEKDNFLQAGKKIDGCLELFASRIPEEKACFLDPGFLEEPVIEMKDQSTPC